MHSADTVEGIQAREGTQCPELCATRVAVCAEDALHHAHRRYRQGYPGVVRALGARGVSVGCT